MDRRRTAVEAEGGEEEEEEVVVAITEASRVTAHRQRRAALLWARRDIAGLMASALSKSTQCPKGRRRQMQRMDDAMADVNGCGCCQCNAEFIP